MARNRAKTPQLGQVGQTWTDPKATRPAPIEQPVQATEETEEKENPLAFSDGIAAQPQEYQVIMLQPLAIPAQCSNVEQAFNYAWHQVTRGDHQGQAVRFTHDGFDVTIAPLHE